MMSEQLNRIKAEIIPLLAPYVSRVLLFGSVAREENGPNSDIDLLVTIRPPSERPVLGLQWFAIEQQLSLRLGRSVELISESALSRHLRPYIEKDCVVLYEG